MRIQKRHSSDQEFLFWVNEEDEVLGKVSRTDAHDQYKLHREVSVVVLNARNQVLMQKRSSEKDMFPNFWTVSATGHVDYGESYQEAATRELLEELGLSFQLSFEGKKLVRVEEEQHITGVFSGKYNDKDEVVFNTKEIAEVAWVDIKELDSFVNAEHTTPTAQAALKTLEYI